MKFPGFKRTHVIARTAKEFGLDPDLVKAVIIVESRGDTDAMRYEPGYPYLVEFENLHASDHTEIMQQSTSWGCMQIMGATAREMGCDEPWLNCLLDLEENLYYGCKFLSKLIRRFNEEGGISAYNQGSPAKNADGTYRNQSYVDKVLAELTRLRAPKRVSPITDKGEHDGRSEAKS